MLKFVKGDNKNIGRADCIKLVTIEEDSMIVDIVGRPEFVPYFLVKLTFDSSHPKCIQPIPTGHALMPEVKSPEEYIVTDGENVWHAVRFKTLEQLKLANTPVDPHPYIVEDEELPERMRDLTTADQKHIIDKIKVYCTEVSGDLGEPPSDHF